jgi:hypothetical protein
MDGWWKRNDCSHLVPGTLYRSSLEYYNSLSKIIITSILLKNKQTRRDPFAFPCLTDNK